MSYLHKKKIFLAIPNLTVGGAEKVYVELVNNLNKEKFKIYLIIFNFDEKNSKYKINSDVEIINLNKSNVRSGIFKFLFFLNKLKPDIVMSSIIHLNITMAILKPFFPKHTKLICRNSNYYSEIIKLTKFSFLTNLLYKLFLNSFDFFIFISRDQKKNFLSIFKVPENKSKLINNPLNFDEITSKSNQTLNKDLFLKDGINFVVCGSFKYQKGFDIMIDAIKNLKEKNIRVLILGSGFKHRVDEIKSKINNFKLENKIKIIGLVDNVFPYFKKADAIIIPSRFEGCCNVLIEALCLQKPIICTPAPGLAKELFEVSEGVFMSNNISSNSLLEEIDKFLETKIKKSFSSNIYKADIKYGIKEYEKVFLRN